MCRSIRGQGGQFYWMIVPKLTIVVEDIDYLLSFMFRQIPVSSYKGEVENAIVGRGDHLCWQIGHKNTNLVDDIEYLIPVKFPQIPVSASSGEVENVSINVRPGQPSLFTNRPEKTQTW